jgi:hypothetical protein
VLERLDMRPRYMDGAAYAAFAERLYREEGETIRRLGLRMN